MVLPCWSVPFACPLQPPVAMRDTRLAKHRIQIGYETSIQCHTVIGTPDVSNACTLQHRVSCTLPLSLVTSLDPIAVLLTECAMQCSPKMHCSLPRHALETKADLKGAAMHAFGHWHTEVHAELGRSAFMPTRAAHFVHQHPFKDVLDTADGQFLLEMQKGKLMGMLCLIQSQAWWCCSCRGAAMQEPGAVPPWDDLHRTGSSCVRRWRGKSQRRRKNLSKLTLEKAM